MKSPPKPSTFSLTVKLLHQITMN